MTIIWTRAAHNLPADRRIPALQDHPVIWLPCTVQRGLDFTVPDLRGRRLIFTGATGVRYFLDQPTALGALAEAAGCLTFGRQTAAYLENRGIPVTLEPAPGAEALGRILVERDDRGPWHLVCPAVPAFDLYGFLQKAGFSVSRSIVYETTDPPPVPAPLLAQLRRAPPAPVCLASPSAVRGFLSILTGAGLDKGGFTAIVPGETTHQAAVAAGFRSIQVAGADMPGLARRARQMSEKEED